MLTDKKISIVVICYNDGGSVHEMHRRVSTVMEQVTPNWELVYVNDASPDNAWEVLKELAQREKRLIAINHARNFGGQPAYTTGLNYCTGDAAILLDGDIQDPPELFPELVKRWLGGYDIIYGEREKRKETLVRRFFFKLFYRVFKKMSYINIPLDASDFCLMDRKVIDVMNALPEKDRYIRGLRAWVGFKNVGLPYTRAERFSGVTNNSFMWYIRWARRLIVTFSYKPLEWISYLAGIVMGLALIAIVVYLVLAIFIPSPRGYLSIIVAILFFGAIQLFVLSIIAEYIGRIFEEVKGRPTSLVKEIVNDYRPGFIESYNQGKRRV